MSVNIRYPNISGFTEKDQITQIKSYLHQLVDQLNYALPNIDSADSSTQTAKSNTYEVQGGELSYYDLRTLIIQEMQTLETMFDTFSNTMKSDYIHKDEVDSITTQAAEKISFTLDDDGNLYYEVEE